MSSFLDHVITGVNPEPPRVVIYGEHGMGKSTFCATAPGHLIVDVEGGLSAIDCRRTPKLRSWHDMVAVLNEVLEKGNGIRVLAVDSVDWLEELIFNQVAKDANVGHVTDLGYGKGYRKATLYWRQFLSLLDRIRESRGIAIALIAHAEAKEVDPPDGEAYQRWAPKLYKTSESMVSEWADHIFLIGSKTYVAARENATAKAAKATDIVVRVKPDPRWVAKCRAPHYEDLPADLPPDWTTVMSAVYPPGDEQPAEAGKEHE